MDLRIKTSIKVMVKTMNPRNQIALASDVELRRPGTEPVTLSGGLRPLVARFTADLVGSLDRLKQLADEARLCKDPRTEAALLAKIADVAANVLRLAKPGGALDHTGPTCQEELLNWDAFPAEVREIFEKGFQLLEEKYGEDGLRQMMTIRD